MMPGNRRLGTLLYTTLEQTRIGIELIRKIRIKLKWMNLYILRFNYKPTRGLRY